MMPFAITLTKIVQCKMDDIPLELQRYAAPSEHVPGIRIYVKTKAHRISRFGTGDLWVSLHKSAPSPATLKVVGDGWWTVSFRHPDPKRYPMGSWGDAIEFSYEETEAAG